MELNELNNGKEFDEHSKAVPEIFNAIIKALKEIRELYVGGESNG